VLGVQLIVGAVFTCIGDTSIANGKISALSHQSVTFITIPEYVQTFES